MKSPDSEAGIVRLNLGSGQRPQAGWVNVDKYGAPDVLWDLEVFRWPWDDNSVGEVQMTHVLEHLGPTSDIYLRVWKELYRVCVHGARLFITVPHPRHDDFLTDPTHVRAIGPESMNHFSKKLNEMWIGKGYSNSPLAVQLDVDFDILRVHLDFDEPWASRLKSGQTTADEALAAMRQFNNVVKQVTFHLAAVKEKRP